jgi:hypothetical protein
MVTYIDICFAGYKLIAAPDIVADKRKLAEDPTPDIQEKVAYRAQPEKKWQRKPGQEEDHEERENYEHPEDV